MPGEGIKLGKHWRQSRLLPKPATNRQQSRLLPIRSTLLPVCTGPKRHGRLCRLSTKSTVLNSTLSPVCTGLKIFNMSVRRFVHSSVTKLVNTIIWQTKEPILMQICTNGPRGKSVNRSTLGVRRSQDKVTRGR